MCIDSNESLLIAVCFYSSSCCRKLYSGGESSVISLRTLVDLLWKTMHFRIMDRFHIVENRPDSSKFNYGRKNQLDGKHLFWLNVAILWMRNLECIAAHESHGTEVNKGDDILIPWHRPRSKKFVVIVTHSYSRGWFCNGPTVLIPLHFRDLCTHVTSIGYTSQMRHQWVLRNFRLDSFHVSFFKISVASSSKCKIAKSFHFFFRRGDACSSIGGGVMSAVIMLSQVCSIFHFLNLAIFQPLLFS